MKVDRSNHQTTFSKTGGENWLILVNKIENDKLVVVVVPGGMV